jgi:hypothetical protein
VSTLLQCASVAAQAGTCEHRLWDARASGAAVGGADERAHAAVPAGVRFAPASERGGLGRARVSTSSNAHGRAARAAGGADERAHAAAPASVRSAPTCERGGAGANGRATHATGAVDERGRTTAITAMDASRFSPSAFCSFLGASLRASTPFVDKKRFLRRALSFFIDFLYALNFCLSPVKCRWERPLQGFAKFYLANLVFYQPLKRYAK